MIYCVRTNRQATTKYVENISRGLPNSKLVSYEEAINSTDAEKVAFMGFLRGGNLVYKWANRHGIDFYYIDRPYWGESRSTPYWMRCTKNQHVKTFIDNRPDDRFKQTFKNKILPYHKNGKHILIIPPSHSVALMFDAQSWLENTLKILKENTDRELVIREKPYNPKSYIDDAGRMIPGDKVTNPNKKGPDRPFEWDQVHAVVTFNSSITIKALTNGVPCFANFDNPCMPVCEQDFTKIETPKYEDPRPVFYSLAYGQFTQEEFRSGYAMEILDGTSKRFPTAEERWPRAGEVIDGC
jgi:hypothetical protein